MNELVKIEKKDIGKLYLKQEKYIELTNSIYKNINDIAESYLDVGRVLKQIHADELYLCDEYKDIYEYAEDKFNIKATTVKNLIKIVNTFCDEKGIILKKFKDYSYSQLIELSKLSDDYVDDVNPSMSVREIKSCVLQKKVEEQLSLSTSPSDLLMADFIALISNGINILVDEEKNETVFVKYKLITPLNTSRYSNTELNKTIYFELSCNKFKVHYCLVNLINLDDLVVKVAVGRCYYPGSSWYDKLESFIFEENLSKNIKIKLYEALEQDFIRRYKDELKRLKNNEKNLLFQEKKNAVLNKLITYKEYKDIFGKLNDNYVKAFNIDLKSKEPKFYITDYNNYFHIKDDLFVSLGYYNLIDSNFQFIDVKNNTRDILGNIKEKLVDFALEIINNNPDNYDLGLLLTERFLEDKRYKLNVERKNKTPEIVVLDEEGEVTEIYNEDDE